MLLKFIQTVWSISVCESEEKHPPFFPLCLTGAVWSPQSAGSQVSARRDRTGCGVAAGCISLLAQPPPPQRLKAGASCPIPSHLRARSGPLQPSEPRLPDLQEPFLALCVLAVAFPNNSHHALDNVQHCGHPCPGLVVSKASPELDTHKRTKTLLNIWFNNKAVRACVCFCCRAISGSRGGPCRAVPALPVPWREVCRCAASAVLSCGVFYASTRSHLQLMTAIHRVPCAQLYCQHAQAPFQNLPETAHTAYQHFPPQGSKEKPRDCGKAEGDSQRCALKHSSAPTAPPSTSALRCCLQNPMVKVGLQGAGTSSELALPCAQPGARSCLG